MSNATPHAFDDREVFDDSLVSRLRVVEEQPLATRAAAFDAMYEELSRELEGVGGLADPRASASGDR